jgi:hypothetical protein
MSEEAVDGVMVVVGDAVAFIPKEDLKAYRLPDDAAAEVIERLGLAPETVGFSQTPPPLPNTGSIFGVTYQVGKRGAPGVTAPSSILSHAMTVLK